MLGQFIDPTDRTSFDDLAACIAAMRVEAAAFRRSTRFRKKFRMSIFLTRRGATKGQLRGELDDISESGLGAVLSRPLEVGSDYWISLDKEADIAGLLHARCVRVRMLDKERFETGFRFYNAVEMPGAVKATIDDEIL